MPRERIPQNELLRRQGKLQQRAPDNCRRGFGKTIAAFLRFTRAPRSDARKNFVRIDSGVFLFSEQDALGGHGNSAEMTAAVPKRFANYHESRFAEPFSKISA